MRQTFDLTDPDKHNFEIMLKNLKGVDQKSTYDPKAKVTNDTAPFKGSKQLKLKIRWFESDDSILQDAFRADRYTSEETLIELGWDEIEQINDHFNEPLKNGSMVKYLTSTECKLDDDVNHSD